MFNLLKNILPSARPAPGERLHLRFKAVVQDGEGRYSRLEFPGRSELMTASALLDTSENYTPSETWPETLCAGSLNCRVLDFPADFKTLAGKGDRIATLDSGRFTPEFCIPRDMIRNNSVRPYNDQSNPRMGIAQVWKCAVTNDTSGERFDAWHVRRVDGTYPPFHGIIELMSHEKMRDAHGLVNGTQLTIDMYSAPAR